MEHNECAYWNAQLDTLLTIVLDLVYLAALITLTILLIGKVERA